MVNILPSASKIRGAAAPFLKIDPTTKETRWRGKLRLSESVEEAHEVKTFRFNLANGEPIPFEYLPGQFVTVHVAPQGVPTRRSYTIASSPTSRDRIEITVKREDRGLVSQWLHDELGIGDEVEIEAPSGTFTFSGKEAESVVLIGGGVGITPLMSVLRYLTATNWTGKIYLILSFRSPRDFIFREELAELQALHANLCVTVTMSDPGDQPWSGRVGRIDADLLASTVPDLTTQRVHVCGPAPMMETVTGALASLGVPQDQIKKEAFGTVKRDPTVKQVRSTEIAGKATFLASGVTAPVPVDATILDAADTAGVSIDNACRSGTCASCRVKLVSGQVTMDIQDGLTDQDKAEGYILACQAKVQGDVEVDI
ncbi:2Fe-2S iron-sulfur cluster-binding protein [Schlesneria sp. T3-172]|uniref:2Fe-2S iron-sulfur cluster-binding protein n=1 Tax=Schlesneria sphaerica TaxID=3373610 RepID=UPI0037CC17BF